MARIPLLATCLKDLTAPRREFLRVGTAALGLGLVPWLTSHRGFARTAGTGAAAFGRARRCILIWLEGGPSHLDLFDPKPLASTEVRGPFAPISTAIPGLQVSELLPGLAQSLAHAALIRSVTSPLGEHNLGTHYLLTGYKPNPVLEYPSFSSVASLLLPKPTALPAHVGVPDVPAMGNPGFLPAEYAAFSVRSDPAAADFRVENLAISPELSPGRLSRRRQFAADLELLRTGQFAAGGSTPASLGALDQAFNLLTSPAAQAAFDLTQETSACRERYGGRTIGQSCLLARRLVEAGVPLVTVMDNGWDTHDRLVNRLQEGYTGGRVGKAPCLDQALAALLADLADRGLLEETLVVVMGEFGRTPKLNAQGGRDHWPRVFSVLLAGGGIRGGQVIGSSDSRGESPQDRPVTPDDLACTLFTLLGIDPDQEIQTADGRPVRVNAHGQFLAELV